MNPYLDLHWYNIPDLKSKQSTKDYFFQSLFSLTGLPEGTSIFVYMYNGDIKDLKNINHNKDTVNYLNDKGLHFFLYEPLCYKKDIHTDHNQFFYSEYEFSLNDKFYADEIESIIEYADRNNLENIIVHTCDWKAEDYIHCKRQGISVVCDDLFLKNQYYKRVDLSQKNILKKFICLNWRYTKHRHLTALFLSTKSTNLSWYYKSSYEDLKENLWFDLDTWKHKEPSLYQQIQNGIDFCNEKTPLCLDIVHDQSTIYNNNGTKNLFPDKNYKSPSLMNHSSGNLKKYYAESFCEIITETRFAQATANFSEKIFQSMRYKTPFIVVGPPETLKYVKSFGFKTFDRFWNEDYDECLNHENRLVKIFKVINDIEKMSITDLNLMLNEMEDILQHNLKNLKGLYD